jgi:hypothetical protein
VRDTKKKSCLRGKKRLAQILMHILTVEIEGTTEAALRKSTLFFNILLIYLFDWIAC